MGCALLFMIIVIISYWCYHKRKKRRLAQKQKSEPRLTSIKNPEPNNPENDSNDHPTYLHTIVSLVGLKYDDIQLELGSYSVVQLSFPYSKPFKRVCFL